MQQTTQEKSIRPPTKTKPRCIRCGSRMHAIRVQVQSFSKRFFCSYLIDSKRKRLKVRKGMKIQNKVKKREKH